MELFLERSWSETIEVIYNVCAIIVGLFINCWTLKRYQIQWTAKQNKIHRILLGLNLTISNFLILLIYCPSQIAWLITVSWPWSDTLCKIRMFACVFVYYLSSNAIVAIAFEMLQTVHMSVNAIRFGQLSRCMIPLSISWILAVIFSVFQLFTWGLKPIPNTDQRQCVFLYDEDLVIFISYQIIHLLILFYIPLSLIIICYISAGILIVKQLRDRKRMLEQRYLDESRVELVRENSATYKTILITTPSYNKYLNTNRIKLKFILRSTGVVVTYVLCWLPYQALSVWSTVIHWQGGLSTVNEMANSTDTSGRDLSQYINWLDCLMISSACFNTLFYV